MANFLITGFSGFVSKYFLDYLKDNSVNSNILGLDIINPEPENFVTSEISVAFEKIDLLDSERLEKIISDFKPNYILHLASYSSVALSWKNPLVCFQNNINIFLNLLEAIRKVNPLCRILSVGSSEEYGNVTKNQIPITENCNLNPLSPYAVGRVAQEMLSKTYCDGYNLDIVMTRSFNHIGPGQRDIFVIPSFAKQFVKMKKKGISIGKIITGDISIVRDFLDVRDVVDAYYQLLHKGKRGEVYNVCSNRGVSLKEILFMMSSKLGIDIEVEIDTNLIRPNDISIIIGSNDKLKNQIGWEQKYCLEQSLTDVLDYWSKVL